MKKKPNPNQLRFDFLEAVKKADPHEATGWTQEQVRASFGIGDWNIADVKRRDKYFKRITAVRRKAFYESERLLLFKDGIYKTARSGGQDDELVRKMLLRYIAMRNRLEKRVLDILKVAGEKGWLGQEVIRILLQEIKTGGPGRRAA